MKVTSRECKFALHIPVSDSNPIDTHIVKEVVTMVDENGVEVVQRGLRYIENFERPVSVVKKAYRNYEQKREFENKDHLVTYKCTESDLPKVAGKMLGYNSNVNMRFLKNSPYLYGTDITTTSLIKKADRDKYPKSLSKNTLLGFDIETDTIDGTDDPIIISLAYQRSLYLLVSKTFSSKVVIKAPYRTLKDNFDAVLREQLGELIDKHGFSVEFIESENTVELIKDAFQIVNRLKPDFLSVWSLGFDIPKILNTLKKYNVDPKDVLCDPSVPEHLRACVWKEKQMHQVSAGGVSKPLESSMQWHSLFCTSTYYCICQMALYRLLRLAKGNLQGGYGLNNVAKVEIGITKLDYEKADHLTGLDKHKFMQTNYKVEYMVYGLMDSLLLLLIDEKTGDLQDTISDYAQFTDFPNFKSNPRKIVDAMYFYMAEMGYVMGVKGNSKKYKPEDVDDEDEEEREIDFSREVDGYVISNDSKVLSCREWILTLPAFRQVEGLRVIAEDAMHRTLMRGYVFDIDAISAYPTAIIVCNVSRSTTEREIMGIEGIPEEVTRRQNMNACMGAVNSVEYGRNMFGLPPIDVLEEML